MLLQLTVKKIANLRKRKEDWKEKKREKQQVWNN